MVSIIHKSTFNTVCCLFTNFYILTLFYIKSKIFVYTYTKTGKLQLFTIFLRHSKMSLDVDQDEKRPSKEQNVGRGANRLFAEESINRLPPKNQSLNEMYDPPGK